MYAGARPGVLNRVCGILCRVLGCERDGTTRSTAQFILAVAETASRPPPLGDQLTTSAARTRERYSPKSSEMVSRSTRHRAGAQRIRRALPAPDLKVSTRE